jgi:hypothetical protein
LLGFVPQPNLPTGLWFRFDDMPEEKNLINQRKYMSAISAKDQK